MNHGNLNHGFSLFLADPAVPHEIAGIGQPSEGVLHNPSLGQHRKAVCFSAFGHRDQSAEHVPAPINQLPTVERPRLAFSGRALTNIGSNDFRYNYFKSAGYIASLGKVNVPALPRLVGFFKTAS